MKKTKIKQRIGNAVDAFFDDENLCENSIERFRNQTGIQRGAEDFTQDSGKLEAILKQVFLFFPGTFILFVLSAGFTGILIGALIKPPGMILRFEIVWLMLLFVAATLMTWLGLGDVRKLKHLAIPASIMCVGGIFGAIFFLTLLTFPTYENFFIKHGLLLYAFPLALIAPFLAKSLVDRKT